MPADKPKWGGRRVGPDGKPLGGRPPKHKLQWASEKGKAPAPPSTPAAPARAVDYNAMMHALPAILEASNARRTITKRTSKNSPFKLPVFPKRSLPPKTEQMAMDQLPAFRDAANDWLAGGIWNDTISASLTFLGYPYLANLAQQPDFRNCSETWADDATRQWIDFEVSAGSEEEKLKRQEEDKADPDGVSERRETRVKDAGKLEKVKALADYMEQLKLRDVFYAACRDDGFFGREHLFLDIGEDSLNPAEMRMSIGDGRDEMSRSKVSPERPLKSVRTIEPVWCYPQAYNAQNPIAADWYNPQQWYVMGQEIHATRLLRIVGRPVPDVLKPAYAFGGLSLSQMIEPSVDIWLETRESVGALVKAFSVMVLSTDLSTMLQPGGAEALMGRAAIFNALRNNQNLMMINKQTEDFTNVSASIAGLSDLQAQAQEHVASTGRIPLVKYTGLQPKGLNASAEGEIAVYDDTIMSYQNRTIRPALATIFYLMQLSLWGEVDEEITFAFKPLRVMTQKEKAELQKFDAERDGLRLDQGAISPDEIRKIIVADPELPYSDLDPDDVPDLQEEQDQGLEPGSPSGGKGQPGGGGGEEEGGGSPGNDNDPFGVALDEWNEGDHPRGQPGNPGQFGPGGGSSKTDDPTAKKAKKKDKLAPQAPQYGIHFGAFTAKHPSELSGFSPPTNKHRGAIGEELDTSSMKKVGEQKGSNPGGVFEDESGKQFYVKKGKSKEHVRNELLANALADLAGTPTLHYRPVKGGEYIASEMSKLDKDRASKLSKDEKAEAQRDFMVHAWLANWDAIGFPGDDTNLGVVKGMPTALDMGGALEYRAQGAPKGKLFGTKVDEIESLRDPKMNPEGAKFYGNMSPAQMRESARFVTNIPDSKIKATVEALGGDPKLAEKLIARKNDIKQRARYFGQEGDPADKNGTMVVPNGEKLPVKELNGVKFGAWRPPADWSAVSGQDLYDEPEFDPGKKRAGSGVVVREPDGRVWLIQPRGGFGGYEASFPKGGLEKGLSLQANAIKEAWEESGLKVRIVGFAGDHEGDTSVTRFYHAVREGGDPSKHDDESEGVVLAPAKKAEQFLNRKRDREVLAHDSLFNDPDADTDYWLRSVAEERHNYVKSIALASPHTILGEPDLPSVEVEAEDEFKESDHPRDPDGEFATVGGGSGGKRVASMTEEVLSRSGSREHAAKLVDAAKGIPDSHARLISSVVKNVETVKEWNEEKKKQIAAAYGLSPEEAAKMKGLFMQNARTGDVHIIMPESYSVPGKLLGFSVNKRVPFESPGHAYVHELGHAFDSAAEWGFSKAFAPHIASNVESLTAQEKADGAYYLNDETEAFAELYGLAFAGDTGSTYFGGLSYDRAMKVFESSVSLLRRVHP